MKLDNFIIFSDIQYYKNTTKSVPHPEYITSWLATQIRITKEIFNYAREHGIKTVFHNGDLFEEKNRIPIDLYNIIWDLYKDLSKEFDIVFNTGNHDMYSLSNESGKKSALKPFSDIVTVVTESKEFYYNDIYLRVLPYGQVPNNIGLSPKDKNNLNILLTHDDISELSYGTNQFQPPTPLKWQLFGDWNYVFNGHIHKPQCIHNIYNIGSPMIQDWGEADEHKGFYHLNLKDEQFTEDTGLKFVFTNCPQFLSYSSIEEFEKKNRGNIGQEDFHKIDIFPSEAGNPIFKNYNIVANISKKESREIKLKEDLNPEEELLEYINIINDEGLDKKKLLEIGMELINEI
jgi:DNA repair exonuclease SbcCD nuclease subunit